MIGMSEAIAPVSAGMEFPLPLSPIGGESIDCVKSSHIPPMPKDIPQWEPFKEYSQSLPLVAKELGDRMEGKNVGPRFSRDCGRVVCASLPVFEAKEPETPHIEKPEYVQVKEFERPLKDVTVASRVTSSETKETLSIETPRVDKPEISQSEASRIEKLEYTQVKEFETPVREVVVASRVTTFEAKETIAPETPRVDKSEISQTEVPRIEKPEYTQVKEFETPVKDVVVASRVTPFEAKETIAPETPRVDKPVISQLEASRINKPEISQSEAPRIAKPEYTQVKEFETPVKDVVVASRVTPFEAKETIVPETPRVDKPELSQLEASRINKPEISQSEVPRIEKPEYTQLKEIEKPVKEVVAPSFAPADEKPEVTLVDIASARVSQNTVVQTPESAVVSHLVETVVETLAVTPTLSSTGEGEIHIKLKSDILDGSSIKIEVKNGELKVVVEPASRAAEEILLKSHEAFQNHLAERVTAWRINVGVATLDLRNNLKRKLEELS